MSPLLSIVIPTKNRYTYLKELIIAFKAFTSNDLEIIIQDNSDDNSDFLNFVNQINDNRIRYFHVSGWLSVCDNCDLGIKHSRGEFITMIGDDDGFIPPIVDVAKYMKRHNIDAVVSPKPHYLWPDVTHKVWGDKDSGVVTLKNYTKTITPLDTNKILEQVISKGGTEILNLPRVYHMLIKASCLLALYTECGTYFPGPSPDMANAIGLSKFIKKSIHIDFPVIITGNGYQSTGGQGARHEHHGKIEDKTFLPKNTKEKWTKEIPLFWSGSTIYAESAYKALSAIKNYDLLNNFNFSYLYAYCFIYEYGYFNYTKISVRRYFTLHPFSIFMVIINAISLFIKRSFKFLTNLMHFYFSNKKEENRFSNVVNIKKCIELISQKVNLDINFLNNDI
jgi:glycosyltransferase involved in cell wall biosynthesis